LLPFSRYYPHQQIAQRSFHAIDEILQSIFSDQKSFKSQAGTDDSCASYFPLNLGTPNATLVLKIIKYN